MNPQTLSKKLFERAQRVIPGGVNSPVRAFKAVSGTPRFMQRGEGSRMWDVDGNAYIDYISSWGPLILGHASPVVLSAVAQAAAQGTSFGAATEREVQFAELLVELVPSLQKVRLVNSGTEATMSALRVARGFTGRSKIVKVAGGYHGHVDSLLVRAGSGASTLGVPDSAGVSAASAAETLIVPYNDATAVAQLFQQQGAEIAALIIEPVAANMGLVPPASGYLAALRTLTQQHGVVLIFDEVITGFRLGLGGAQQFYNVTPDMTCLGKIIGGGLPVGAYGGRAELMDCVAPLGAVYQAGTLSGNPLAVAAGLATLQYLKQHNPYDALAARASQLAESVRAAASQRGVALCVNQLGSMLTVFFADGPVTDWDSADRCDRIAYGRFFNAMLDRGIYLPPAQFEAMFVSTAHTDADITQTIDAAESSLTS